MPRLKRPGAASVLAQDPNGEAMQVTHQGTAHNLAPSDTTADRNIKAIGPGCGLVYLWSAVRCRWRLGDNTVEASATDKVLPPDTLLAVPLFEDQGSSADHVSIIRSDGNSGATEAQIIESLDEAAVVVGSLQTAASGDDAIEDTSDTTVVLTDTELAMCFDGTNATLVGLRFDGMPIPQGATIQSAHIRFTAAAGSAGSPSFTIAGDDADDAALFTTANADISGRTATTATVAWSPDAWTDGESGDAQVTPDLASIVQEIVDRASWASGNAMAFVVSSSDSDASNLRVASAFDDGSALAPVLVVEWAT